MAILVMAIGTAVAITMFAFVSGILWSPLGLKETREVLHVEWSENDHLRNDQSIRPSDFEEFKRESKAFDKMTGFRWNSVALSNSSGEGPAKKYEMVFVESNFFDFTGSAPLLGRTFLPEDVTDGKDDKIVISQSVWEEHFDGDPEAMGAIAMLDGKPCTVVGVMPAGFYFPSETNIWVATHWPNSKEKGRTYWERMEVIGVLGDGVSKSQAKAELDTIAGRLAQEFPDTNENLLSVNLNPFVIWGANAVMGDSFQSICYVLLFCALLVLAVASANVFNLVMTRIATRTSELSIRSAMGARRSHIVVQVILDGLMLTVLGALGGTLIAGWSLKLIWAKFSMQRFIPYWWNMDMDGSVLGFVLAIVIVSALASSLVPGLRAARSSVAENLKDDSRTSSSLFIGMLSKFILAFQITITGTLAFVSVMMILVWIHLNSRELPYEAELILSAELRMTGDREDPSVLLRKMSSFRDLLLKHPGVDSVAFSVSEGGDAAPRFGTSGGSQFAFEIDGEVYNSDEAKPKVAREVVSEGFNSVFDVEPLIGRSMSSLDTHDTQMVCMVNKTFADFHWPNEDPLGKRLRFVGTDKGSGFRTVVGVMPNILPKPMPGDNLVEMGYLKMYIPYSQTTWRTAAFLLVRSSGDLHRLAEPMQRALRQVDSTQAFQGRMLTLRELNDRNMAVMDLVFSMFGAFGAASLILGVVGLYAIMSFTTKQRFREFGIRMALGADSKVIMMAVVKRGSILLAIGGVLGVGAGHAVSMVLKSTINVHQLPLGYTYPIVVVILGVSTMVSMGVPAWRASRLQPSKALRVD